MHSGEYVACPFHSKWVVWELRVAHTDCDLSKCNVRHEESPDEWMYDLVRPPHLIGATGDCCTLMACLAEQMWSAWGSELCHSFLTVSLPEGSKGGYKKQHWLQIEDVECNVWSDSGWEKLLEGNIISVEHKNHMKQKYFFLNSGNKINII